MLLDILQNCYKYNEFFLVIGVICLVLIFLLPGKKAGFDNNSGRLYKDISLKKVLSKNEAPMYHRLCQAFPRHIVFCQVSFSALLNTKNISTRNKFSRRMVDFILVNKDFVPLAAIEYDDKSHSYAEKQADDMKRDTLLNSAGIPVFRFKSVPSVWEIRKKMWSVL